MAKFFKQHRYPKHKSLRGKTLYSSEDGDFNQSQKEEWMAYKRLGLTFAVTLLFAVITYLFGIQMVNSISAFWLKFRSPQQNTGPAQNTSAETILFPPRLDSLPNAINDLSKFKVAGWAPAGADVIIFINQQQVKSLLADASGHFEVTGLPLQEGQNEIYAVAQKNKDTKSQSSEIQTIIFDNTKPKLTIEEPDKNTTITPQKDNDHWLTVAGATEPNAQVFINDNQAIVDLSGNFKYKFPLTKGKNNLKITARDEAGNETVVERTVILESTEQTSSENQNQPSVPTP